MQALTVRGSLQPDVNGLVARECCSGKIGLELQIVTFRQHIVRKPLR